MMASCGKIDWQDELTDAYLSLANILPPDPDWSATAALSVGISTETNRSKA